jgi:predicted molibdopterin-dependent oxidoreductase YjgC
MGALIRPRLTYRGDLRDVDLGELRTAIQAVLSAVPQTSPASAISISQIEAAMRESKCHYLWFC